MNKQDDVMESWERILQQMKMKKLYGWDVS